MGFLSKKEKSFITPDFIRECVIQFIATDQFKQCLNSGEISDGAQWLMGFGKISMTQSGTNEILLALETNGKNGITEVKKTFKCAAI